MSAKEIIESQMNDMRHEIADANHQVGRIEECLEQMQKILEKFEATDVDGDKCRYCCTRQQKMDINGLIFDMTSACRRV